MRLIDVDGYDIVDLETALNLAEEQDMNLVAMNNNEVPVCRIMDYKKYLYEQQKKSRQSKANKIEVKEVRFNPVIADHDLEIKANTASRLLRDGDKVRVVITYKGRMIQHISTGVSKLNKFNEMVGEKHRIDKQPQIEGNRVYMVMSPDKK